MAQMRATFQEELRELEELLDAEAELVLRSVRAAVEALVTGDSELADEVIAFDDDIDEVYLRTQQAIELLLARQTPVASDLRLVLAILHSNLHLERMGDLCTTIAKLTKLSADLPVRRGAARRLPRDGRARPGDDPRRARGPARTATRSSPSR